MNKTFKYYPESFGKLSVAVVHMDLEFDMYEKHTIVTSSMKLKATENLTHLELNADDLEIISISCDCGNFSHKYDKEQNMIKLDFASLIPRDKEFIIHTKTKCKPTNNVLEGLYYDRTPSGAPPTMITQCQQWGFQRIVPCVDDMTAKCAYTTKIIADNKYSNLITNGDVSSERTVTEEGRATITYSNITTPMAPYLFFLGVGTYDTHKKEFEYPDGSKFMLELLVFPGSDKEQAEKALDIMYDGIIWIYLFTGKDKYKNETTAKEAYELVYQREQLKKENLSLDEIRKKLYSLTKDNVWGYKYTGTVYREIAMQNSDFGGMENVGNTTITANRIMPFKEMTDGYWEYMFQIKVHEYYHNINGSEVTGRSPFEIWLNEAVTVRVEQDYSSFKFGKDYQRLMNVLILMSPGRGALSSDEGSTAMPIEPDGFNTTNELITEVTYRKAPEFVRMIEQIIGKEIYVKGLAAYHEKFKHSNASRNDWIESMEQISNKELKPMAAQWLKKTGYPKVRVYVAKEEGYLHVRFEQVAELFEFPLTYAVFQDNKKIVEKTIFMKEKIHEEKLEGISNYSFLSVNRDMSFYGKTFHDATKDELILQAVHDDDVIGRYFAFNELYQKEISLLLNSPDTKPSDKFVDLYYSLLTNKTFTDSLGSYHIHMFESVEDENNRYRALYESKKKIMKTIAEKYESELKKLYGEFSQSIEEKDYINTYIKNMKLRSVKNTVLSLLSTIDSEEVHELIKAQYISAGNATDKISGLALYLDSSAKDKINLLHGYASEAVKHPVSWENLLRVVGSNDANNSIKIIKEFENNKHFDINQANDQRALYTIFMFNKKLSLQTEEGRKFFKEIILKLAPINEYNALAGVKALAHMDKMRAVYHIPLVKMILECLSGLDKEKQPSVYNNLKRILDGSIHARKTYEEKHGKIAF